MPSLREQQLRLADAMLAAPGVAVASGLREPAAERLAVYRNTVRTNYRNALGATYAVVQRLVGAPFFNAAVDAFVSEYPSTSGDLNDYGAQVADFIEGYAPARDLPYLPDVARLGPSTKPGARQISHPIRTPSSPHSRSPPPNA